MAVFLGSGSMTMSLAQALEDTAVLGLQQAIDFALQNNPDLKSLMSGVDAAKGRAYQAGRWSNPKLQFGTEEWQVNRGFSDATQTVGISQTLPFPGKISLDQQIRLKEVEYNQAIVQFKRVELIRDVKSAFYGVLANQGLIDVARELVDVAKSSADATRRRVEAGDASDQELLRTEIQLEQARTDLLGFDRECGMARQDLANLLGMLEMGNTELSGELAKSPDMEILFQSPKKWISDHPSAVAAKTVLDRAELQFQRAKIEPMPDVEIGVAAGQLRATNEAIVELRLSLPLPFLDTSKGRKDEARARISMADADAKSTVQRLQRDWAIAGQRLRVALEQVENYRERILPRARKALELVRGGFEQGKFGLIDVLDTQRTLAHARLSYQRKLLEMHIAESELEALVFGVLSVSTRATE